ncbi:MAG: UvrD-helicase domain-containing protein, partial [Stomatobaculum longum]|nr:UvrD-helicase domain-containing protein [Stomatobaculum longum]
REYQAAFREIYVDEYQDSNGVQEELLRAIETGRLFLVGDIKQSIYGFRHAKPELFAEKYHNYRKDDGGAAEPGIDTRVDLRKNFRSREAVLASCNAVFSYLMREELGGVRYDADAALYPGAAFPIPEGSEDSYATELMLVERDAEGEETATVVEAEAIATRIRELLDPAKGLRISDGEGGLRAATYGDIAILLRATSGQAERFVEVLMSHGIPALAEQKTGYFDATEVRTVLSLLRAIDNPFRDIPLAAVLRAPIGGLSEEELASLAAKGEGVSLYERLEAAVATAPESTAAVKAAALFRKLEAWREAESYLELPQFLRLLYTESGYRNEEAARPGGELRFANLQMLIVKAEEFESIGYRGLSDFVRYIDNLKKYNADYGSAQLPGEEAAAVRIMTVHKSKGLEFPIVFLAGLSKRFNQRDLSRGILYDEKLGIAADAVDYDLHAKGGTAKKAAFAWHLRTEALGEELRVLYVAMTRAKEKLILVAGFKEGTEPLPDGESSDEPLCTAELRSANSYLEWILMAMARDKALCRIVPRKVSSEAAAREILETGEKVLRLREELRKAEETPPTETEVARFAPLMKPYAHAEDVRLQVKWSASELKRLREEREEGLSAPLFSLPQDGGSEVAARRGTAYHKLFERIDFTRSWTEEGLRDFLKELAETGALPEEDGTLIALPPVIRFLQSALAARLASAQRAGTLHRETSFVMAIPAREADPSRQSEEPVVVQGVIDAWFEEVGQLVVLDYKTDKATEEAHYREKYTAQLSLYARALAMTEEKTVAEKLIYSTARGEVLAL